MNGTPMRLAAWLVLAAGGLAQENVDPLAEVELPDTESGETTKAGTEPDEPAEPAEPWGGTWAEGMAEVVRLAANEDHGAALELTERLLAPDRYARLRTRLEESLGPRAAAWLAPLDASLAWLGVDALDDAARAEVRYVRGLLQARTGAVLRADEELGLARALAGPGATRNDAVYALGTLDLLLAEELRRKIPEISGATAAGPAGPGMPGAAPPGGEEEPDTLELARAAYLEARAHLVERLRLDWRDADTRANTELIQRRLRELDEIERQREEQEQEQEQQEEDSQDQASEDQESEDQESEDQESEDQESQDSDSEEEEPADQDSEQEGESEDDEAQDSEESESEDDAEPEAELEERVLTQEEMMRLLEEFQRYQEQGVELREQNRRVRRENVEKDW